MVELEHEYRLVERLAAVTEGNARAHLALVRGEIDEKQQGWTKHEMLAASGLVIAASYWSLIDSHRAVTDYRLAAETYRRMGHDYWIVAALAAGDRKAAEAAVSLQETEPTSPQTLAFAMIAQAIFVGRDGNREFDSMARWWRHFGNVPVGRLRIPLNAYGRLAEAMSLRNRNVLAREATYYISRAAEVIETASHDHFHWRLLRTAILPAEPEAAAMATMIAMILREMQIDLMEVVGHGRAHARRLVDVGVALRDASSTNDDDRPRLSTRR